ncbi:protein of unknown function [Magnetospirillum gryphiswaldense MSR-1 v2]|uniref:Uncharacterized protein n=1 Tax=Magnetospirillum gryphiswaldense (strain DSM 6361 / JCM 21280 / NBRC 15271 / MSR-1) TaxID=431944 RepID=V6F2R3_MAGGM|nr:protein of unknown function [Magnetospirillum gryphiswaldense MSR-1 v2]
MNLGYSGDSQKTPALHLTAPLTVIHGEGPLPPPAFYEPPTSRKLPGVKPRAWGCSAR